MAQPLETKPRQTLMRWIVGTSLNYRFLVVAIGALLMVFGVATLPSTRVDAFPEFAPPRVVIQTACLGLSTSDVEQLVTVPLEQALNGVEGLEDMRSKSVPQLSAIELIFKQGFNELKARQLVQERMTAIATTLPTWAAPPVMLAPVSATGRAVQIGMTSKDHSLIQMSMSAYWTIRARLLEVPGVANVALWGERLQMMQVQVEPPKMEAQHVALNEVMEATADAVDSGLLRFSSGSIIGTGGMVESPNQRINVRNVLPIITPDDLAKVPLHVEGGGKNVKIGDVARVVEDHQPLIGDAVINDSPGLLLVVEKLPWANTVEMTKGVEEAIRSLEPGLPGVQFDTTIFQQANFITASISNLTRSAGARIRARHRDLGIVPLRVAGGLDQHPHHPAVADDHAAGLVLARGNDQHHDSRRVGDRLGGGGGRRHHRRREHRQTITTAPAVGW